MEFVDTDKDGFLSFDEYKGKYISQLSMTIFKIGILETRPKFA